MYDFLLVISSNLGPILQGFWDTATYWLKKSQIFPAHYHLPPFIGGEKSFTDPETRVFQAADSKDLVILTRTVFDWFIRVTDGRTDKRTELRCLRRASAVPAVARN